MENHQTLTFDVFGPKLALIGITHLNERRLRFSSSNVQSVCLISVSFLDTWNSSRNLDRPYNDWNSVSMLTGRIVLINCRPSCTDVHSDRFTKGSSWWWWLWWCWWWWWWLCCLGWPSSCPESLDESLDRLLVAGTAGSIFNCALFIQFQWTQYSSPDLCQKLFYTLYVFLEFNFIATWVHLYWEIGSEISWRCLLYFLNCR